ncbi:MAG: lipid II flippase Amj family protein [bacterium]
MNPLIAVCFFTGMLHFAEASSSCLRLAGIRTGRVATSISFVNASLLVSRMSNMLQAPFLGGMVDTAIYLGNSASLVSSFRLIIFAAFIGNLVALILAPSSVQIFTKAITKFKVNPSVPRLILSLLIPRNFIAFLKCFRLPRLRSLQGISLKGIPKTFLVLNILVASIYAIGVLAALMAGALVPEYRVTAVQLSAIINGMATILFTLMVDPGAAHITDQAAKGERPENDVRTVVFYLLAGRVVGTLVISQLLFMPGAEYIKTVTLLVKDAFLR